MKPHQQLLVTALGLAGAFLLATAAHAQWTNYIEVEDYNHDAGQFVSDATTGMDGPYQGGVYTNQVGVLGVDYAITLFRGGTTGLERVYRTTDFVDGGIYLSDRKQAENVDRGHFSVVSNWKLAWQDPGEWQNYTRIFSNAVYAISIFAGADNAQGVRMTLETVTSDPTQPDQTVETIGFFNGPNTGGVDVYAPLEATDAVGQPLRIRLSGTNTLRLTQRYYSNTDYLKFVAREDVPVMPPYLVSVVPAPEESLTTATPIRITIRRGDHAVDPSVIRLSVNDVDVTASAVVSATADGGATVFYDYDRGLPVSTAIPVQIVYGDTGSPATLVTNSWSFVTPASWPIILSANQVALYPGGISEDITVSIPRGFNADNEVLVEIFSSEPTVAAPVGGADGVLSLVFPAGGANTRTFNVEALTEGTAQFTTENMWGLDVATLTATVSPTLAVSLLPSSPEITCWTNSTLVLRAVATGIEPFSYTWKADGVTVPGVTGPEFPVSILDLTLGSQHTLALEVANPSGTATTDPVSLTAVAPPPAAFTLYEDSFSRSGGLDATKPDVQNPHDRQWLAGSALLTDGTSILYPGTHQAYLPFVPEAGHVYALTADLNGTNASGEWLALGFSSAAPTTAGAFYDSSSAFLLIRANHTGNQQSFITIDGNPTADGQNFECFHPTGPSRMTMVLDTTSGDETGGWTVTVWQDGTLVATHVYPVNPSIQFAGCGGGAPGAGLIDNFQLTDSIAPPEGPAITTQPTPASTEQFRGGTVTFQVAAAGSQPLSYQWQSGITDLPGETNSTLVLDNLTQSGTYRVVVRNANGSVTSDNAVVTLIPDPLQAAVLYQDSFEGTGALDGREPEVNTLAGVWTAFPEMTCVNSEVQMPSSGTDMSAYLPFTPEPGHVYVLAVDMNPLMGTATEWSCLGFVGNPATSSVFYNNNAFAWMLQRLNRAESQMFVNGFGAMSSGPGGGAGYTTWKMVLDTTTGDASAGWTVRFVLGRAGSFGNQLWSYVYETNPAIAALGIGGESTHISANFDNLLLTDSAAPQGSLSVQRTADGALLSWSEGLLLEASSVSGPWTTNSASPPSITVPFTGAERYYRVVIP